jgi:hypothetical protein
VIAMAVAALPLLLHASPAPARDPKRDPIREAVRGLGRNGVDSYSTLKFLAKEPRSAVTALVEELAVIRHPQSFNPRMLDEPGPRAQEMSHAIWCVRGLDYLTGLRFLAPSRHRFTRRELQRRAMLLREGPAEDETAPGRAIGKQFPFFATWMSRDTSFIAPEDAQREIIAQWRAWLTAHGATHRYEPDESWDWYFGGPPADVP